MKKKKVHCLLYFNTLQHGTKFSDSKPGSSSPPQRSKIRTTSTRSSESHKASKSNKSSNGSHLPGNRLTRPVSSLPEPRKENSDVTPDPQVPMARIQRLSEPKTVSSPYVAPMKSRRAELVSKPKLSNEPERKDISTIINLDKSKAATLPELKIRTSKLPLDVGRNTSAPKEMTQKVNVKKSSLTSGSAELNRNDEQHTHQSDVDGKPVIDKTVVMLECETAAMGLETAKAQVSGFENLKLEKIPEVLEKPQAK
ncbi:hypothetical protein LOK49_LG08G02814, partial [Camellia lanceoleosa]